MADIYEFTSARCPYDLAPSFVSEYLRSLPPDEYDRPLLELRVAIGDLTLSHDVIVRLWAKTGLTGYERFGIAWEPKGGGPFPTFEGTLTFAQESSEFSRLEIDGQYTPPLGPIGMVFDLTLGKKIASATAGELLARLKDELEAAYAFRTATTAR